MMLVFVLFQKLEDVKEIMYWLYPDLRDGKPDEKVDVRHLDWFRGSGVARVILIECQGSGMARVMGCQGSGVVNTQQPFVLCTCHLRSHGLLDQGPYTVWSPWLDPGSYTM